MGIRSFQIYSINFTNKHLIHAPRNITLSIKQTVYFKSLNVNNQFYHRVCLKE